MSICVPNNPNFAPMKKIWLLTAFLIATYTGMAQQKTDTAAYLHSPALPAFNIELLDGEHQINTGEAPEGKPTVLMFFSPDCEHCKTVTQKLLARMDSLSGVQFYLVTPVNLNLTRAFANELHLDQYPNIIIGRDYNFYFPTFFHVDHVPYLALYDRKKQFVHLYDGHVKMEELIRVVNGL